MFDNIEQEVALEFAEDFIKLYRFGVILDEDKTSFNEVSEQGKIYFTVPQKMDIKIVGKDEKLHHIVSDSQELIQLSKDTLIKAFELMYDKYEKELSILTSAIIGTKEEFINNFHFYAQVRDEIWTTEDYEKETQKWIDIANKEKQWKEV